MAFQVLDISAAQGYGVDFNAIKKAGYKGVVLRAGYGSALRYPTQYDPTFENNYKKAKAAGLYVGAYWYTYCTTTKGASEEATAFAKALAGKQFELPVYMDIEEKKQFDTGMTNCSAMVRTFCNYMEASGYFAGVYCSTYWYTNYVDKNVRDRYACWIAEWNTKCTYQGSYGMWQNGTVSVNGILTDHDYCYVDYPTVIKNKGLNGFAKHTPKQDETVKVTYTIKKKYKDKLDAYVKTLT